MTEMHSEPVEHDVTEHESQVDRAHAARPERERRLHTIDFILRAIEPIAHGQETQGNAQIAMRSKVMLPSGRFERVPIITGDTMRHGLREAGTDALREAAGIRGGLTESALRLLYNGGMVRGSAKDSISIEEAHLLEELCPHLAMLGGCIGNRIVPGKVESGYAWLICSESAHLMPEWVGPWLDEQGIVTSSAREHMDEVQRVKMDALLNPQRRQLLAPDAAAAVEQRMIASDVASARDDAKGKKLAKSTMMPFTYETIVSGSLFYWRLVVWTDTEIERDALAVMIAAFFAHAKVGGKKGTGHGAIAPLHVRGHERIVAAEGRPDALAVVGDAVHPSIARFRDHVGARVDRIERWLRDVQA